MLRHFHSVNITVLGAYPTKDNTPFQLFFMHVTGSGFYPTQSGN